MSDRYQLLPPLTDAEYQALRDDIAVHGVLVAVVYDQHGDIIDGHHRVKIARELGIDYPTKTVEIEDEDHGRRLARVHNLARRHLSRAQRRELIAEEITTDPDRSNREIGRLLGVDHKTVGSVRRELAGEIPHQEATGAEEITTEIRIRLDAFDFALLLALASGVEPATVLGWLTIAKQRLTEACDDEPVFEPVIADFLEPRIAYVTSASRDPEIRAAYAEECCDPLTDEEIAGLGRAISGGALVGGAA